MASLYYWGKPIAKTVLFQIGQDNVQQLDVQISIKSISCGEKHCLILSSQEQVYGFGDNSQGQIGSQKQLYIGSKLSKIHLMNTNKIKSISCGWNHTLLLDDVGNVYSSGNNRFGQIGRGKNSNSNKFQIVLSGAQQVSAGKDHSLALIGYKVMGWGNSHQGQLGLLSRKAIFTPQQLNVYPCKYIYAGCKYSLFITTKGIYGTGLNQDFQLGLGHEKNIQMPKRINIEQQILCVNGGSYNVAKTINSQWYIWGTGGFGVFQYPTKMSFLKGSEKISLGSNFGALYQTDKLWVWGNSLWGQFGLQKQFVEYAHQVQIISDLLLDNIEFGGNFMIGFRNYRKNNYLAKNRMLHQSFESQILNGFKKSQQSFDQQDEKLVQDNIWIKNSNREDLAFLMQTKSFKKQSSSVKEEKERKFSEQLYKNTKKSSSSHQFLKNISPKSNINSIQQSDKIYKKVKLKSTIRSFYNNKYHFSQKQNSKSSDSLNINTQHREVEEYFTNNYRDTVKQIPIPIIPDRQMNRQHIQKFDFYNFDQKLSNLKCIMQEICQ